MSDKKIDINNYTHLSILAFAFWGIVCFPAAIIYAMHCDALDGAYRMMSDDQKLQYLIKKQKESSI